MGGTLHISLEDFQDVYSELIESLCKSCVLYRVLLKYDIVAVSPDGERYCPYSYVEAQEELAAIEAQGARRKAKKEADVLVRAEKKLEEVIAERDALKEESLKYEIEMCKLEGSVCRLKSDIAKKNNEIRDVKKALEASERACMEQKGELAKVCMDNKKVVTQNKKLKDRVAGIKETVKRFAEGVMKDVGD